MGSGGGDPVKNKKKKKPTHAAEKASESWGDPAGEGQSTSAGKDVDVSGLAEESSGHSGATRSAPIGLPISDEEYRSRKERARTKSLPAVGHAHEDPKGKDGS